MHFPISIEDQRKAPLLSIFHSRLVSYIVAFYSVLIPHLPSCSDPLSPLTLSSLYSSSLGEMEEVKTFLLSHELYSLLLRSKLICDEIMVKSCDCFRTR